MVTRILRLNVDQPFGRLENPLWQVAELREQALDPVAPVNPWSSLLVPFEFLTEGATDSLDFPARSELQTFIDLDNLNHGLFRRSLQSERKIQVWIDRKISKEEASILQSLLRSHKSLDLVYLPDLHSHPEQIFENFQGADRILVHLKIKKIAFDRWLTPFEMWDRILWLRESNKFSVIGTQILESQIPDCGTETEKLFLLNPTYENLMFHLRNHDKVKYWAQVSTRSFLGTSRPGFVLFLRLVLGALLKPTKKNLFEILRSLKNSILFYPFRKVYWMIEYAVKKRILKK